MGAHVLELGSEKHFQKRVVYWCLFRLGVCENSGAFFYFIVQGKKVAK